MTEKLEIYKCNICGNIVQILQSGPGNLICCGEEMELLQMQYKKDELGEKHIPKFEIEENSKRIKIYPHPMTKEHYIQFIEAYTPNKNELHLKFFKPEEIPTMDISYLKEDITALEYCNIHGLWGNTQNG